MEKKKIIINLMDGSHVITEPSDEIEFMEEVERVSDENRRFIRVEGSFSSGDGKGFYKGIIRINVNHIVTAF